MFMKIYGIKQYIVGLFAWSNIEMVYVDRHNCTQYTVEIYFIRHIFYSTCICHQIWKSYHHLWFYECRLWLLISLHLIAILDKLVYICKPIQPFVYSIRNKDVPICTHYNLLTYHPYMYSCPTFLISCHFLLDYSQWPGCRAVKPQRQYTGHWPKHFMRQCTLAMI